MTTCSGDVEPGGDVIRERLPFTGSAERGHRAQRNRFVSASNGLTLMFSWMRLAIVLAVSGSASLREGDELVVRTEGDIGDAATSARMLLTCRNASSPAARPYPGR